MWRKAVQLQKTALRESFLEVIRLFLHYRIVWRDMLFLLGGTLGGGKAAALLKRRKAASLLKTE